jgi:isoquinoline 1-oxidoreductase beta subunit
MNRIDVVSRRGFLGTVFSAGAFVLGAQILPDDAFAAGTSGAPVFQPTVYLGIEPDGRVIITAHRSEMGTGIRTALPMVLADELDVDWKDVRIEQAIGDKKYGDQNTDGSTSIRSFYEAMRQSGATARLMLERAAAAKWGVPAEQCKARNGQVTGSGDLRGTGVACSQTGCPEKGRAEI